MRGWSRNRHRETAGASRVMWQLADVRSYLTSAGLALLFLTGCAGEGSPDGRTEAALTFALPAEGSCEAEAMRKLANEATLAELDGAAGLDRRAAESLVAGRPFASLAAVDASPRIGDAALRSLLEHVTALGACTTTGNPGEIGVISDLDKTVIPEANPDLSEAPYPGVPALYALLESRKNGKPGDVHYVTARTPQKVVGVPAYLAEHGVPAGSIDTGVSGIPGVARKEKVRDIEALLARTGSQRFVLFGDTSHVDPEVYRDILASHADRVLVAFIHGVDEVSPERVAGMTLHHGYAEVAATLFKKGIVTKTEARGVMKSAQDEGAALTDAQIDALLN